MQILPYHIHWALHPNIYVAPYTNTPIEVNGNIEKDEWASVPWSYDFDDIRGEDDAPSDERPSLECRTRMKMMWDDDFLYIAAILESDMEVRATFEARNSPIYHEDSDFEVFVDPNSSCHHYKELEMNAINTVWNLMLDKPYADGGQEHSGRIAKPGDEKYYDVEGQKTAVRILEGSLNKPGRQRTVWAVEIALSHRDTMKHQLSAKPQEGDQWRINFSRVEMKGKINWTWQKQKVWDPEQRKHCGKVDMHMPDAWGYVRFGPSMKDAKKDEIIGEVSSKDIVKGAGDPMWPTRLAAMNIYYAQRRYYELNNMFANSLQDLSEFIDEEILAPYGRDGGIVSSFADDFYKVQVRDLLDHVVSLDSNRLMSDHARLDLSSRIE